VVAKHADPEPAQILAERLAIPRYRPPQAARVLRVVAGQGLQRSAELLVKAAKDNGAPDNISVVLLSYNL